MRKCSIAAIVALIFVICTSVWAADCLRGLTVDESGRPVRDAKIDVIEYKVNAVGEIKGTGRSFGNGRFQVAYAPMQISIYPKLLFITAQTIDKIGFTAVINPNAGQRVVLYKKGSISGTIKDSSGNPIKGALIKPMMFTAPVFISVSRVDSRSIESAISIPQTTSDANGNFTINGLPLGWEAHLTAYLGGLPIRRPDGLPDQQWSSTLSAYPKLPAQTKSAELAFIADPNIPQSGGIRGTVFDIYGRPMPDVMVNAVRTVNGSIVQGEEPKQTVSDKDGNYKIDGLAVGHYVVSVFDADYPIPIERDVLVTNSFLLDEPLFAQPGVPVSGRVADARTGVGIAGVVVASPYTKAVVSRKDGSFNLKLLPGEGMIIANGESVGYRPIDIAVQVPDIRQLTGVTIKLMRYRTLTGRVIDHAGKGVDGAWIQSMLPDSPGDLYQSDIAGNYRISADANGPITLIASDRFMKQAGMKKVAMTDIHQNKDIKLGPTASLRGMVVDQIGNPVADAHIMPMIVLSNYRVPVANQQASSNVHGEFELHSFIPGAEYVISIRAKGYKDEFVQAGSIPKFVAGKTSIVRFQLVPVDEKNK